MKQLGYLNEKTLEQIDKDDEFIINLQESDSDSDVL